jgi:N-acetylmuramoyl-L-alanine amidase
MTGNGERRSRICRKGPGSLALAAVIMAAVAFPVSVADANDLTATDARIVGDGARTRFVADLTERLEIAVFTMADPYRVIVDLPNVRFALPQGVGATGRGLISAFRYGQIAPGKSRIVLDATGPVAVNRYFVIPPADGQPARLVVDLVPSSRDRFLEVVRQQRPTEIATPIAPRADRLDAKRRGTRDIRIVIDPGHGGIDSGAVGATGTLEKTLVLDFSKRLGEALRATGRYDVVMTRDDDSFIPLRKRVEFARAHDADLFLSVHANSFAGGVEVKGATVYTLSERASDRVAAAVAASENRADILAGMDIPEEDSDQVKDILLDLTRRETKNFGIVFAKNLIASFRDRGIKLTNDPRKEASFIVLEAPDVPSALIELGYLSTSAEEELMKSAEWQEKATDAMIRAIDGYFATRLARGAGQ